MKQKGRQSRGQLVIGVGVTLGVALLILISGRPLAYEPPGQHLEDTAILFLIDESSGVNGRCDGASSSKVLPVDVTAELRYDFVRFFTTLWRAYYASSEDPIRGWQLGEAIPKDLPHLQISVAQFARDYQPLLNWTSAAELSTAAADDSLESLESASQALASRSDASWFCFTNYPAALEQAEVALAASGATRKLLVLVTDGVFRGFEAAHGETDQRPISRQNQEAGRAAAADDMVAKLRELRQPEQPELDIDIYVLLLGSHLCQESAEPDPTCGTLDGIEQASRRRDLNDWYAWESNGLVTLIDSEDTYTSFSKEADLATLTLMPGNPASAWLKTGDEQSLPTISGEKDAVNLVVITSENIEDESLLFRLLDPQGEPVGVAAETRAIGTQWFMGSFFLRDVSNSQCVKLRPRIGFEQEGLVAYYWVAHARGPAELQQPAIQYSWKDEEGLINSQGITAEAKKIIANRLEPQLFIEVDPPIPFPAHPTCYVVGMQVGNMEPVYFRLEDASTPLNGIFALSDLPWDTLPVRTWLALAERPDQPLSEVPPTDLSVVYELQAVEPLVDDGDGGGGTKTRSVTFILREAHRLKEALERKGEALQIWALVAPRAYWPEEPTPVAPAGCPPIPDEETILPETISEVAGGLRMTAHFSAGSQLAHGDESCTYSFLRVRWQEPDGEENEDWLIVGPTPTPTPTATHTPPPTATPTPTATPDIDDGFSLPENCSGLCASILVGVILILMLVFIGIVYVFIRRR